MHSELPKAAMDALKFEEHVLENGLVLRVLPMPNFGAVHAVYSANFGSINRMFEHSGIRTELPAGVAHFLEHKMFENEDGIDAFTLFGKTGAAANAYTSFDRTSYIFTATSEIDRNLDILLSFVGHPHFTKATVKKEQGIIAQEIGMYDDNAEIRCLYGILECLYNTHPVRDDIAGTVDSIAKITPEMLYKCTDAYYSPQNMVLCAAGNISMQQVLSAVQRANLPQGKSAPARAIFADEAKTVCKKESETKMSVSMPMFALGFKEAPCVGSTLKTEVICDMFGELLFGETSKLYRKLYDEGLVQPDFGGEYGCNTGCLHYIVSGESEKPQLVKEAVLEEIAAGRKNGIDAAQFEMCKKMMYGDAVADLDNVERMASALGTSYFKQRTPADELAMVAAITKNDVDEALQYMLLEDNSAFFTVMPL